eukprot:scaffold285_cov330-Pavlova_lutheri.AAC.107
MVSWCGGVSSSPRGPRDRAAEARLRRERVLRTLPVTSLRHGLRTLCSLRDASVPPCPGDSSRASGPGVGTRVSSVCFLSSASSVLKSDGSLGRLLGSSSAAAGAWQLLLGACVSSAWTGRWRSCSIQRLKGEGGEGAPGVGLAWKAGSSDRKVGRSGKRGLAGRCGETDPPGRNRNEREQRPGNASVRKGDGGRDRVRSGLRTILS